MCTAKNKVSISLTLMQWSYGITCWEVFSGGKTPYPGINPVSLVRILEDGERLEKPANAACPHFA